MPTPRAKRPRRQAKQGRALATVDAILEAAARILVAQGYAGASTNRLAEAAGVSIGTLYEYFANREQIFDALIRRELDALVVVFMNRDLDPNSPLIEKLTQLITAGMASMKYGPELFRALEQAPDGAFRSHLAGARNQVIEFIRQILEEHRSELRVTDLELAAFVTVSAVEGVASAASNDRFDARLASELQDLLGAYLTGPA